MSTGIAKSKRQSNIIAFMLKRVSSFSILDWAVFKACLISLGILLGAALSRLFKKLAPLMTVIFILSWFYLIWRVFLSED